MAKPILVGATGDTGARPGTVCEPLAMPPELTDHGHHDRVDPDRVEAGPKNAWTMIERVGRSSLAWLEAGHGPPIVFLHGLGGTSSSWSPQLQSLADRFRCIAWDLPGYGRSPLAMLGETPMTFDAIVEAIGSLLDDLELERATFVGLSFGGQQALHFALAHPGRVDRLVLADTSAVFGADGTSVDEWKRLRLGPLERGLSPADMAEPIIDAITGPGFSGPVRRTVIESFGAISSAGLRAAVECLPRHDVSGRLGEIEAETLVVVGEFDEETPLPYSEALERGIRNARLVVIRGVGHLSPSEDPDTFNDLITRFLSPS